MEWEREKIKCAKCGAGIIVGAILLIEASSLICDHCGHEQLPLHLPEGHPQQFDVIQVSGGISETTTSDITNLDNHYGNF